ncbi:MAG: AAA family ATPase [Pseudomonadota bacterium]
MYNEFFRLDKSPFNIQPDPEFLYPSKNHALAIAMLEYGIQQRSGFVVVTGEIGCGKTTLVNYLLDHLNASVIPGVISHTALESEDLLRWVLQAFDQAYLAEHKIELLDGFKRFLIDKKESGHQVVLIVDEAQNLTPGTLEELRMLSNLTLHSKPLLQLIFIGQPQLRDILEKKELDQFAQRISADFHLTTLGADETRQYIEHRLSISGRDTPLFDDNAVELVYRATNGIPRKINIICDTALVYGFASKCEMITSEIVAEVLEDKSQYGTFRKKPQLQEVPS